MKYFNIILLAISSILLNGCMDFDKPEEIKDLRILGVKVEPPEILTSFTHYSNRLDIEGVPVLNFFEESSAQVEVIAFDPREGDIKLTTQMCPTSNGRVCEEFDYGDLLADFEPQPENQEGLEAFFAPRIFQIKRPVIDDQLGEIPDLSFELFFDRHVIDTIYDTTQDGLTLEPVDYLDVLLQSYANLSLRIENNTQEEVTSELARKLIPIAVDTDNFLLRSILETQLDGAQSVINLVFPNGQFCDVPTDRSTIEEGETTCLYPRVQNQNPQLIGFEQLEEEDDPREKSFEEKNEQPVFQAETATLPRTASIEAARGETIILRPVFADGAIENYQTFTFDPNTNQLSIVNRFEDFAASLYVSGGSPESDLMAPQFDGNLDFTWLLREDAEPGDTESLVVVVRDQRGGLDYGRITVTYTDEVISE